MNDGQAREPASRASRLRPLDHLRPGELQARDQPVDVPPPPAEDPGAAAGKATRSPAAVATRDHLESAEQGPA